MSESVVPDTKDWTWVLDEPCPECGYDVSAVTVDRIPEVIRDNATTWEAVLTLEDAAARPAPGTWSPLEYACHVRDVHRIFEVRIRLMVEEDEPTFANWDQDETAIAERYAEQDPATVSVELLDAAETVAERYEWVPPGAWSRRGFRSNGSEFSVESLGLYHLHDVLHHAWDVRAAVARATVEAYDASAGAYRDGTSGVPIEAVAEFAAQLGVGARVLEIGSAGGRDARALEAGGLSVRPTDVAPGFVELMREEGLAADLLDPLTDDLDDPGRPGTPYDGVWANACLLHVDRTDLPVVLRRLADATAPGGLLRFTVKEGDGERWSTHGHVAAGRRFTFWRAEPLAAAVRASGWEVESLERYLGSQGEQAWLDVRARKA
ncbi:MULTISPECIES: methyltransferase domain-containing protein [unclassified Nocardioides]|uniref:methyltransferase domain-containing protein n=1 Tax=Nocardioides sp. URHA0032 TaxID=1380388 RepID=UPI000A9483C9|nr:methyltransferase domain-containing protein [Nocardioides sp. URHA0032]